MSRPYFYKDSKGQTRRLYYCSFCSKGPFREEDRYNGTFALEGPYNMSLCTCRSCLIAKSRFIPFIKGELMDQPVIAEVVTTARVQAGQVWRDKDKRRPREVTIDQVDGAYARYKSGGRTVRVSVKRLEERWELKI